MDLKVVMFTELESSNNKWKTRERFKHKSGSPKINKLKGLKKNINFQWARAAKLPENKNLVKIKNMKSTRSFLRIYENEINLNIFNKIKIIVIREPTYSEQVKFHFRMNLKRLHSQEQARWSR